MSERKKQHFDRARDLEPEDMQSGTGTPSSDPNATASDTPPAETADTDEAATGTASVEEVPPEIRQLKAQQGSPRGNNELDTLLTELWELSSRDADPARQVALSQRILVLADTTHMLSEPMLGAVLGMRGDALTRVAERRGGAEAVELLEQAIACYDVALEIRDRATMAPDHATTQQNKAIALTRLAERRGGTEAVELLEQAIACYDVALGIFDRVTMAPQHARARQNKGIALQELAARRGGAEGVELLEQAIACCNVALGIFDRATMTPDHAKAQLSKGNALYDLAERRGGAEGVELLEQAIACYDVALAIYPQAVMPKPHRDVAGLLAQAQLTLALLLRDGSQTIGLLSRAWIAAASGLGAARILEQLAPSLEFRQAHDMRNEFTETFQPVFRCVC